ncbi:MAG: NAD(P)H-hydrate epimerase [Propionibacteriaceae bacterium]|nr:NAD(P)H-hydrate epimerase [Propionibacteriaceae bacterium]
MGEALTSAQMKALDETTIRDHHVPSMVLMERAALACVDVLREDFDLGCVHVYCGPGNNGGDGIAIARLLHLAGVDVLVFLLGDPAKFSADLQHQITIAESYGVPLFYGFTRVDTRAHETPTTGKPHNIPTTVVDAILGIGAVRAPAGEFLDVVRSMAELRNQGTRVLAVDIPSGVNADTGAIPGEAVQADTTVTFAYPKIGLTVDPGRIVAGRVVVADIGIY